MEVNKKAIVAYCIIIVSFLYGCRIPIERNDIYARCAKGDTLKWGLFKKAERIIVTDKYYYIWLDLYDDHVLEYARHLLVCDHNLVLKGATGIIPEIIDARGDTLLCITNEEYLTKKNARIKPYRDDLPNEVKFSFKNRERIFNGYGRNAKALVDSIKLMQNMERVKIYLKTSDSVHFPGRKEYFEKIEYYTKSFKNSKVLEYPISSFYCDRGRTYFYIIDKNDIMYEMHTLDDLVVEKFLMDCWHKLNNVP